MADRLLGSAEAGYFLLKPAQGFHWDVVINHLLGDDAYLRVLVFRDILRSSRKACAASTSKRFMMMPMACSITAAGQV